jgi:hypothetical protein
MDSDKVDPDMNPPDVPPEELPPDVPRARNVLLDILEQNRAQIEDETARLMDDIKARDESDRQRRDEEERLKAAELRARVEEERRLREEAERAYEERKARQAAQADVKARPAAVVGAALPVPEKKRGAGLFIGVAVFLLAVIGVAGYLFMPRPTLATMDLDRPLDTARPGAVVATPLPYGPTAVADAGWVPAPEVLVARVAAEKYEPPEPEPVVPKKRGRVRSTKPKPLIDIQEGILGGRKVVR